MIKYIYAILLFVHGIIHFIEFARVFGNDHVNQFSNRLPGFEAFLWLFAAVLFIISTSFFLRGAKHWPYLVIFTAIASQVLILTVWKESRIGTAANAILILGAIPALVDLRFTKKVQEEAHILSRFNVRNTVVTNDQLNALPAIVRKWLIHSRVVGKNDIRYVRITQKGKMRFKAGGKWMSFHAVQFINTIKPAFIWKASIKLFPGISLVGIDRFSEGRGEMHMKLFSLFNVARVLPNEKMNSATMIRYLAEVMWYPTAALHDNIHWEATGGNEAKASISLNGTTVSGTFIFSDAGDIVGFEALRFKEIEDDALPINWKISVIGYKDFNDFRIPYKGEVTWCLANGDFTWAVFELESLEYNILMHMHDNASRKKISI